MPVADPELPRGAPNPEGSITWNWTGGASLDLPLYPGVNCNEISSDCSLCRSSC